MGFRDKVIDILLKREGSRYKSVEWAKRNKVLIGFAFWALSGYVVIFGCPGLAGDHCDKLALLVANLGSFLTGAGLLDSDFRAKFVQEKEKLNGN